MDFSQALDLAIDNNEKFKVVGILVVKAKERTRKSKLIGELATKIAEKLGSNCFNTKIRESVSCNEVLTASYVSLNEYAPYSTTNKDYQKFVDELL